MGNSQSSSSDFSSSQKQEDTSRARSRSGSRHGRQASSSRQIPLTGSVVPFLKERNTQTNGLSIHDSSTAASARLASPRQVQNVKASFIPESPFVGSPLIQTEDLLVDAVAPRLVSLSSSSSHFSPLSAQTTRLFDSGPDKPPFPGKHTLTSSYNPMVSHSVSEANNLPQPAFFPLSLPNSKKHNSKEPTLVSKEKSVYVNPLADAFGGLPTLITWNSPAQTVYLTGTFNGWKHKIPLGKSLNEFSIVINFPPGIHHIKFIVDDEWKCSNDLLTATDQDGNLVNYIEVDESSSPIYDSCSQQPDISSTSPPGEYINTIPDFNLDETFHKRRDSTASASSETSIRPPLLPPHLEKVLLNAAPILPEGLPKGAEDAWLLPVPNHVVLNHLYACSIRDGVMAVAGTSRYRNKYITTIFYKPVVI